MSEHVRSVESRRTWSQRTAALIGYLALAVSPDADVPAASHVPAVTALEPTTGEKPNTNKPNIIFFLADDMEAGLLKHMPNAQKHIFEKGATFENYFTNVSLCCPARASIFTGKYAHNTGVVANAYPDGFHGFHTGDEKRDTFAVWLEKRGYDTALLGKYLNEYPYVDSRRSKGVSPRFVPNGWTDWVVPVKGQFAGDNYLLNENGSLNRYSRPKDHLSDLMARRAIDMIQGNKDDSGLMIEYSYYGPHMPEPASPIERNNKRLKRALANVKHPRTPAFNEADISDKTGGLRRQNRLTPKEIREIDRTHRDRVLSVKTMDRHIGKIVRSLKMTGQLDNTYLVFTSDNGYHLGEYRMKEGKNSPFDTDTHLPLGIRGPGIKPGTIVDEVTGNIDIAPTFADMANTAAGPEVDGESLLPLAQQVPVNDWRDYFYIQRGKLTPYNQSRTSEPGADGQYKEERRIIGYAGVISQTMRYVEYATGDRELYDITDDPYQIHNLLARSKDATAPHIEQTSQQLSNVLRELRDCEGPDDCRIAD